MVPNKQKTHFGLNTTFNLQMFFIGNTGTWSKPNNGLVIERRCNNSFYNGNNIICDGHEGNLKIVKKQLATLL